MRRRPEPVAGIGGNQLQGGVRQAQQEPVQPSELELAGGGDQHQALDPLRVGHGELGRDGAAERMPHQHHLLVDAQHVQHAFHVGYDVLHAEPAARLIGVTVAAQVDGDDAVLAGEGAQLVDPLDCLAAEAVQEDDRALGLLGCDVDHRQAYFRADAHAGVAAVKLQVDFHARSLQHLSGIVKRQRKVRSGAIFGGSAAEIAPGMVSSIKKRCPMTVKTISLTIHSQGNTDIQDISGAVEDAILQSGLKIGTATVFCPSSTSAVTTIEYESGCLSDLRRLFNEIIDPRQAYQHNAKWGDGNGHSHVRAALLGAFADRPLRGGAADAGNMAAGGFRGFRRAPAPAPAGGAGDGGVMRFRAGRAPQVAAGRAGQRHLPALRCPRLGFQLSLLIDPPNGWGRVTEPGEELGIALRPQQRRAQQASQRIPILNGVS